MVRVTLCTERLKVKGKNAVGNSWIYYKKDQNIPHKSIALLLLLEGQGCKNADCFGGKSAYSLIYFTFT